MCFPKSSRARSEELRVQMHRMVDRYCDDFQNIPEGEEQEQLALRQLEDDFDEVLIDNVDLYCQSNSQESTPLLPDERQELRSRVRRPCVLSLEDEDEDEVRDPRESFCDRALRLFQRLLGHLQQKWQALLAWVRKTMADGKQVLCRAVEAVWSVLKDFCSFMAQALRSVILA